jgi:hypothetical protein
MAWLLRDAVQPGEAWWPGSCRSLDLQLLHDYHEDAPTVLAPTPALETVPAQAGGPGSSAPPSGPGWTCRPSARSWPVSAETLPSSRVIASLCTNPSLNYRACLVSSTLCPKKASYWSTSLPIPTAGPVLGQSGNSSSSRCGRSTTSMPRPRCATYRGGPRDTAPLPSCPHGPCRGRRASPDIDARAVLTIYGLFHTYDAGDHPLTHAFLKAIKIGAERQCNVTLSPLRCRRITGAQSRCPLAPELM